MTPRLKEKQNIPEGWHNGVLGSFLVIEKGKMPKKSFDEDAEDRVPYLSIKRLDGLEHKYAHVSDGVLASKNDLLVIADGSGSGRMYKGYSGLVSSTFLRITSRAPEVISNDYLESIFQHLDFTNARFRKGGAIPHFDFKQLKNVLIQIPPLKEQQKIAEILEAVDEDIAKTKEVIATTEKLKRGLMQQLFMRGIGHTKFKQTAIGEVPEEWEVVLLDVVARRGSGHTPNKKVPAYYGRGIKWVSLADSNRLEYGEIYDTKIDISEEGIKHSSAVLHPKGTVLMSRDAGVGRSAIMGEEMAVSQHFMTWQCGEKLHNWYLYYYLQSYKKEFERIAVGSTIKTIGLPYFKRFHIPLPPIKEQRQIADTFVSLDEKITVNKKLLAKLTELKKGLMQDLLSGNVRVNA